MDFHYYRVSMPTSTHHHGHIPHRGGFTLIELLIGFALMGALLMVILVTLDPFEQQKKGVDVRKNNAATAVYNAITRSYISRGSYPWSSDILASSLDSADGSVIIQSLIQYGELKSNFSKNTGSDASSIYLIASSGGDTVSVCFVPTSKSYRSTSYDCSVETCYVCIGKNSQLTRDTLHSSNIMEALYSYPRL